MKNPLVSHMRKHFKINLYFDPDKNCDKYSEKLDLYSDKLALESKIWKVMQSDRTKTVYYRKKEQNCKCRCKITLST